MSLQVFAEQELDLIGMTADSDEMNVAMRKHILHMIKEFADEGHSGFSANYAIGCLTKLLKFEPLSPLTGEDDEWTEIAEDQAIGGKLWQNKRCGRVFKDSQRAYDVDGKIFWEWHTREDGTKVKTYYTSADSRVDITFPYVPVSEYVERASSEPTEKQDD